MTNLLCAHFWAGVGVWVLLYVSDNALTIMCARLYQRGVRDYIVFEGSYELTPYFQRDVDELRAVSPRFWGVLILTLVVLFLVWRVAREVLPEANCALMGALILGQLAVHVRHFRNLFLFRAVLRGNAVRGRLEYNRPVLLESSAIEMLSFAALYGVLFGITGDWFMLGGTLVCVSVAAKHRSLVTKARL